jgi:uncharacterized protein (TIGR02646 family)
LTDYARIYPQHNWDDFRDSQGGKDYREIKSLIFSDQDYLCAFCETIIKDEDRHKQRVEHFHPKADISNPNHNWALDWENVIGVCLGGSDVDKSLHPLPANLSCDAYKDYLINTNKLPMACEGHLLNPLQLPKAPCLFDLNKRTGELQAKADYSEMGIADHCYSTVAELVENTIRILNLNCDRLNQQRLKVLAQYNREIGKARKNKDKQIHSKLVERWLQSLAFFTTRRILLGQHAESHLQKNPPWP